jgi:hypothetical protein
MVSRLTQEMVKVIQEDAVSQRGLRNVLDGELELLLGFDFNVNAKLGSTLFAQYASQIDRPTGQLSIAVPPFSPLNMIGVPTGTTHFKIVSAGAEVDFESDFSRTDVQESAILPLDNLLTANLVLTNNLAAASTFPLFLILGIQFYQEVNGTMYPLKNGAFNALNLVQVDGGV